jgi:hypothetical protein
MKNKLLSTLLFIILATNPGSAFAQLISWTRDYLLSWSDFQGGQPPNNNYSAETRWDYRYRYNWTKDGVITVKLVCSFDKQKSWKNPRKNLTTKLLLHEQLHFYVAELFARKMRQAFGAYASAHKYGTNTAAELGQIFNKLSNDCNSYQSEYDIKTNHGMSDNMQEEWRKKIVSDLNELSAFEAK